MKQQIKNFKEPIKDLEAWLAYKNAAGQNRWKVYYKMYQSSRPSNTQNEGSSDLENSDGSKTEKRLSLREEIELRRQEVLAKQTALQKTEQQETLSHEDTDGQLVDESIKESDSHQEDQPNV